MVYRFTTVANKYNMLIGEDEIHRCIQTFSEVKASRKRQNENHHQVTEFNYLEVKTSID